MRRICKPGDKVAVLVSDVTRRYKTETFFPWLLDELNRSGVKDEDIKIIFARGAHRPQTVEEQRGLLGETVAERVEYCDHDCHDMEELIYLGSTSRGAHIRLNMQAVKADKCILTVEYHYYAWFTGGRKSVLPGIASHETIQQNHRLLFEPGAMTGKLKGNPVHEDMPEAADMLRPDFLINLVLNASGDVAGVFAGDYKIAHLQG